MGAPLTARLGLLSVVFGGYSGLAVPHHVQVPLVRPIQGSNITNGHIVYFRLRRAPGARHHARQLSGQ